ncbi:MAG: DUF1801 domain-containing protein [Chitinophagaceae bacterium]|nr:MAG: DUF1801 domain-containing protein [Chitinophagaceae bacterium]
MTSNASTPEKYLAEIPEERQAAMERLRNILLAHLPPGFEERMAGGMLNFCVPHSLYPKGYHCNPQQALPFIAIASQKNFIALYHMGMYSSPELHDWFVAEYPKHSKTKLDMGKSCIRFKKPDAIPFDLIAQMAEKMSPQQWIGVYESQLAASRR